MGVGSIKAATKQILSQGAPFYNRNFAYMPRIGMALSRGALNIASRDLDPLQPTSWEFSAFSQNGEDGIIDHLLSLVRSPNRYFVEIGASDGLENNTSYLAFAKKYSGLMVEGDRSRSSAATRFLQPLNWSVAYLNAFVEPETARSVVEDSLHVAPDFFSLDIDGNDYFVMRALLEADLRPKIICVEYNSTFGPSAPLSIEYTRGLDYLTFHPSHLYYGASVEAWRRLLGTHGYRFVTVDCRGTNAFFIDPDAVSLGRVDGLEFAENAAQLERQRTSWEGQFAKIAALPFHEVPAKSGASRSSVIASG
jgi:hypothetical protein